MCCTSAAKTSTSSAAIVPAIHGRVKAGFDKDGKLLAVDMFVIGDNGPSNSRAIPARPDASLR